MKKQFVVFDIDGTLYNSHLGVEFLKEMSALNAIRGVTREFFTKQYQEWLEAIDRTAYYEQQFDDYYNFKLKGVDQSVFEEAARKVATHAFPHFYSEILVELEKHRQANRFIILISKSPEQAVEEISRLLKADAHWGWQFNFDANGKYVDQFMYPNGESEKDFIVLGLAEQHNLSLEKSYAYGDSVGDISMLHLVTYPTAVNPEPPLLLEAKKEKWRVIKTNSNSLLPVGK